MDGDIKCLAFKFPGMEPFAKGEQCNSHQGWSYGQSTQYIISRLACWFVPLKSIFPQTGQLAMILSSGFGSI